MADAIFRGQPDLVLLCIAVDRLTAPLDPDGLAEGEEDFPHIHGQINLDAVVEVLDFPPREDGTFALPRRTQRVGCVGSHVEFVAADGRYAGSVLSKPPRTSRLGLPAVPGKTVLGLESLRRKQGLGLNSIFAIISLESLDFGPVSSTGQAFRRNDGCHWRLLISGERTQVANLRYRMSVGSQAKGKGRRLQTCATGKAWGTQVKPIGVSTGLESFLPTSSCLTPARAL